MYWERKGRIGKITNNVVMVKMSAFVLGNTGILIPMY